MPAAADPKGYYAILGVSPTAGAEEIRNAFREQAKLHHPDQAGQDADGERFQRIRDAYEVLRDARGRMQYDAERLTVDEPPRKKRKPAAEEVAAVPAEPPATLLGRIITFGAAGLAILLLVTLGMLWSAHSEIDARDAQLETLYQRLGTAMQDQADVRARYRGANFIRLEEALDRSARGAPVSESRFVLDAELTFQPGSSELDGTLRQTLDRAIVQLAETIAAIPTDRDWLVLLEGHAGEAARADGVSIDAWEMSLLRIARVVDHLVAQGMPAERLGVRFQAGFQPIGETASDGDTVELKLLCCYR